MKLETFFENFGLLTDAPNAAAKLRELVLQLAVRGQLVERNPDDDPALNLLKAIEEDKQNSENQRRSKKSKILHSEQEKTYLFQLPSTWQWTYLENIADEVHYGYTASADFSSEDVRLLRITDIQDNRVNWSTVPGCEISQENVEKFKLKNGNILIARTGGTIGKSYLVEDLSIPAVFASYLIRVVPNKLFSPRYLKLFLDSELYWSQLYERSMGTGQPNVNATSLKSLVVPIPPLAEQKRIVEACDRILTLCDKIDQYQRQRQEKLVKMNEVAIAKLLAAQTPDEFDTHWQNLWSNFDLLYSIPETIPRLRQTILELAVRGKLVDQDSSDESASALLSKIAEAKEKLVRSQRIRKVTQNSISNSEMPFEIAQKWAWARLGDVILDIEAGTSPLCEKRPREGEEWAIIKISAISWDTFNPNENKVLPIGVELRKEFEIQRGDFLISRANTSQLVGKSVVVEETPPHLLINDKTLRVHFPENIERRFFNLYNNSPTARQYYAGQGTGTSDSMKNITREQIRNLPVPVPPLAEQKRIVAKVDRLMELCDAIEGKLKEARAKRETLMEVAAQQVLVA